MMLTRPILRYHGGKWKLAPWVISHFPRHEAYVEPFGGAASVLLRKEHVPTEIYNDLDNGVVNVFRVLQDKEQAEELQRLCELTPFARSEFNLSYEPACSPVEQARRFIVRSFFGYGSKACVSITRNGFRSLRSGDASPAVDWSRYAQNIPFFVERLHGVVIEQLPAIQVIERYDRPGTLLYVDPPYVHSTRNLVQGTYNHEMTDSDHEVLARTLHACKGMVVLSGYPCDMYRDLYGDWRMVSRKAYADKCSLRTECLWLSPNVTPAQGKLMEVA